MGRAAEGIRQFIARITICLEEVEAQARKAARAERTSVERWIAERIVSVGLEEPYRWKDSVQSGDEIRLWMADGVAHNLRPWITKFNAKPIDRRWLPMVEEFYGWHYRNEKYLRNEKSLAEVAMVYSQQRRRFTAAPRRPRR